MVYHGSRWPFGLPGAQKVTHVVRNHHPPNHGSSSDESALHGGSFRTISASASTDSR
jgi:hypothetical protein